MYCCCARQMRFPSESPPFGVLTGALPPAWYEPTVYTYQR
jgi:hypothetical protein